MFNIDIVRAWKDREYRHSLSEEQRSQLPENPAGAIAISNADMESISGGGKAPDNSFSLNPNRPSVQQPVEPVKTTVYFPNPSFTRNFKQCPV